MTENYLDQNVLTLKLEAEEKPCLKALHSILEGKSARIVVEECEPLLPRYQVANELIVEGNSRTIMFLFGALILNIPDIQFTTFIKVMMLLRYNSRLTLVL